MKSDQVFKEIKNTPAGKQGQVNMYAGEDKYRLMYHLRMRKITIKFISLLLMLI